MKQGNIPEIFEDNPAKLSQKHCEARWTTKNRERHYGYKKHVNADAKTKLITRFTTRSANVHDSQKLEDIVDQHDNILLPIMPIKHQILLGTYGLECKKPYS